MATLNEFAKNNTHCFRYTAWRDKTPENTKAWTEAVDGFKSGLPISVIVQWLKTEHGCPLSYHTILTQLNETK